MAHKKNNPPERKQRSDTKIGTIEKQYGVDFNTRSDKKLGNYLKEKGYDSLGKALNRVDKNNKKK